MPVSDAVRALCNRHKHSTKANVFLPAPFFCPTFAAMKKIVISVDGFSSCGKSTMARQMAKELNYVFVDSGAMYRAIALYFLRNKIDFNSKTSIDGALANIELEFVYNSNTGKSDMYLNGENVEAEIRDRQVSENVSNVAAIKEVREFAVAQQQKMGEKKGLIMDGRDIGTTVFPKAELKIFMTASNDVRAVRRYKELIEKDPTITLEEVRKNLEMRDHIDSTREISPLRKADDAVVLDNSNLTPDEQLALALSWARERAAE